MTAFWASDCSFHAPSVDVNICDAMKLNIIMTEKAMKIYSSVLLITFWPSAYLSDSLSAPFSMPLAMMVST